MAFSLDPSNFLLEANEFSVPTRGNNLRRGQDYYGSSQQPGAMAMPLVPQIDMGGTNTLGLASDKENQLQMRFAGDAINAFANIESEKRRAEAERNAARSESQGSMIGGLLSLGGTLIGALCDERAKEDIAPLQTSEVNDDLAQMAFAVQEIRGHS